LADRYLTPRFLGVPEPVWRILLAGTAGAIWLLVIWHLPVWANDCALYIQNPKNFTGNMRGLIEDCMRTGYAQAVTTIILGGIGGGLISTQVGKALSGRDKGFTLPPEGPAPGDPSTLWENDSCSNCGARLPENLTPGARCPYCGEKNAVTSVGTCPKCGGRINLDLGVCPGCKTTFKPPDPVVPPEEKVGPPTGSDTLWENDTCENCGAKLPDGVTAGARCPACGVANPVTSVGACPKCGERINLDAGFCVGCKATFDPPTKAVPPVDKVGPPTKSDTLWENDTCDNCGAKLPDGVTAGGRCPDCGQANPVTSVGACPRCGSRINLDTGFCIGCKATFDPPPKPTDPDPKADKPPLQAVCPHCSKTYFVDPDDPGGGTCPFCQKDLPSPHPCTQCGAPIPSGIADGRCPACGAKDAPQDKPVTAECPNCHRTFFREPGETGPGMCPYCQQETPGQEKPPLQAVCPHCGKTYFVDPDDAGGGSSCPFCLKDLPASSKCVQCGADVPAGIIDGRCPSCGAKTARAGGRDPGSPAGGTTPTVPTADSTGSSSTQAAASAGGGTPSSSGAGGAAGPAPAPPPDPPMDHQGVIKGDKAVQYLEDAGLAKVTRDSDGKVTKIEEAYPGAFNELGGKTITMKTGESPGGGTGPDWVEEAKGRITGLGSTPNADGTITDPVIVVNHSDSQWREVPPPTPDPITAAIDSVKDTFTKATQQAQEAVKAAQDAYADAKAKVDLADTARDAYNIAKFVSDPAKLQKAVEDLARELDVDPVKAKQILEMDSKTWDGIKAGIEMPGKFLGGN
jgi:DNA-directed RNA polymerase subunit RPC12/RpoP